MEACELLSKEETYKGIETEMKRTDGIEITTVRITNDNAAEAVGKPKGTYISIEADKMKGADADFRQKVIEITADMLKTVLNSDREKNILVAGLGNRYITPDSLGPKVVAKILVTRHIRDTLSDKIDDSVASVAAIAPGVMGITGIETAEILKGIIERIKPDAVIAIDALAARRTSRINSVIQIADSGISPGSGVGNKRMLLNEESLGVPVIGIGVPTVVSAATLVNDSMERILSAMAEASEEKLFYNTLNNLGDERETLIAELLEPYAENMFVTPKEVDEVIERLAEIISNAINIAVHPALTKEDINKYV
ncbi:MAG: GPR endopeptidase [Clostridiales bacterium]|nr:GPR endopeptidase [Clostridiales bacterium]